MSRTLLLYRHADASRPPATPDPERDLSARGESEAAAAARWLAGEGLVPDLVVVSPSIRTRRTWALTAEALAASGAGTADQVPVVVEPAVYRAGTEELVGVVHDTPDDVATLLVCGHEPGLSEVASWLAADDSDTAAREAVSRGLRKGSIVVLEAPPGLSWRAAGAGDLRLVRVSLTR